MAVEWTIRAQRHLRRVLARQICGQWDADPSAPCRTVLEQEMGDLSAILEATFPGCRTAVVQDQLLGYRNKAVFVLLVEVFGGDCSGSYVVKIGPVDVIEGEIRAWESCRPEGLHHDLVFLPLRPGCSEPVGDPPRRSLVYGDAHQFLGVETVRTFEEAALGAILRDHPTPASVAQVLSELYERIGHLFYSQSFEQAPGDAPGEFVLHVPRLPENLDLWDQEPLSLLRRKANLVAPHGPGKFLDPVDYLRYVNQFVPFRRRDGSATPIADPPPLLLQVPLPSQVVPGMLRGCAHGDLHGRNILIGLVREKALWPTLFDYEDMSPCNLLGWDFVKLETELKIRAYPEIFDGTQATFVEAVHKFEAELGEETQRRYAGNAEWTPVIGSPRAEERLRQILLEIRHRASLHLGTDRRRPDRWLEEYSFLSACYGVCTARFSNLQPKERLGAFVSAGTAAARLGWPRSLPRTGFDQP